MNHESSDNHATEQVAEAFDLLRWEIDVALGWLKDQISDAIERGEFTKVGELASTATAIEEIVEQLEQLEPRWVGITQWLSAIRARTPHKEDGNPDRRRARRSWSRLPRGTATPEESFYRPILQVLVRHGGSAPMATVLDELEAMLGHMLNEADRAGLQSNPNQARWRNKSQWARLTLVRRGLTEPPRRRGIWEISEAGRRWIASGRDTL